MNTQADRTLATAPGRLHHLTSTQAMHLGRRGGELSVVSGRIWLTRNGDLGDHVLHAGQRMRLGAAEDAVIEPWNARERVTVRWNPRQPSLVAALLAEPLRGVAFLAGRLANACAGLARQAAAGADWAQGRVGANDCTATPER